MVAAHVFMLLDWRWEEKEEKHLAVHSSIPLGKEANLKRTYLGHLLNDVNSSH
jgi:hypothetical protein